MIDIPRLVVAAPASGTGKTTVTTGLMAAFAQRGLRVSPHKVGPDYIDPGYHALATGRPGRNLDAYMCGPELVGPLFAHGARGCELAVVEGVMGLYDGASGQGELASTAQVAKLLRAPVVLVVDASSQSRSVAALVHGFASFDPQVRIGGVILNKVGSDRHEALLRDALEEAGMPVLGALRRAEGVATPSRHLGLVPVAERHGDAAEAVAGMAAAVRRGCDLDALLALARTAGPLHEEPWDPADALAGAEAVSSGGVALAGASAVSGGSRSGGTVSGASAVSGVSAALAGGAVSGGTVSGVSAPAGGTRSGGTAGAGRRPVIAVAGGPAFSFLYAEHPELLTAAGADVVVLDPLRDERLPEGTAGLVIGGGFPEVYVGELAANEPLRAAVAGLAASGAPVAAECAGLLYLARSLDGRPMCGVVPGDARMSGRLTLGYRDAVAVSDSALAVAGTRMRGHEFHRTVLEPGAGSSPAWGFRGAERRVEGFVRGGVHASYLHTHWAAAAGVAARFVAGAAGAAGRGGG
ncbi:cobyrinate a,c-diamide synthase [Streptomyces uncialis]|uniref:cobyrinate a,c-diamide synthase n=1 Tax=Streptomyces uncialis TaxID=1048205 RepID=UPI0037F31537